MPKPLTNRRRKEIASLGHRKYRERLGQTLVEGVRSVEAAVAAGAPLVDLVVTPEAAADPRTAAVLDGLDGAGVPVYEADADELAALSDVATSQGVLAVAEARWADEASLGARARIVALDAVQDPGNAGTLIRAAAWFGAEAVVAGPGTVDLFHPKVVRAAMGGLWDLALVRTASLGALLTRLGEGGHACYGADLGGTPAHRWAPRTPGVLVLGSEAHGLSDAVTAALSERVTLVGAPGRAATESLNVAVAAGVLLHRWWAG